MVNIYWQILSILLDNSGHIVYYEKNYALNQHTNIIIYNYCQDLLTNLVNQEDFERYDNNMTILVNMDSYFLKLYSHDQLDPF